MFLYVCQTCSSFVLQYLTMMVCPGLTTLSSAKLWRISLTAFSHRELPAAGSSPPRRPSCLLSCSSSPRSAPVNVRPVEEYTKWIISTSCSCYIFSHMSNLKSNLLNKGQSNKHGPNLYNSIIKLFQAHTYLPIMNSSLMSDNLSVTLKITLITCNTGNHPVFFSPVT